MLAQLIPTSGGRAITLSKSITVVGRSATLCDLVIDHTSISKMHCLLVKTDGLVYMRDLGSTNGTRVNGQRVIRGALLPGDRLSFSSVTFKVHLGPDQPAMAVSPNGATEMLPAISDVIVNDLQPSPPQQDAPRPPASKTARSVRRADSDVLPAD